MSIYFGIAYPLSFSEFYSTKETDFETAWNEYLTFGGMPLILSYNKTEDKVKYLQNLFKETYLKDIIERNKIKNTEELEELFKIVASGIGCLTNPKRLENSFQSLKHVNLSAPAIKQYLDYLENGFIILSIIISQFI